VFAKGRAGDRFDGPSLIIPGGYVMTKRNIFKTGILNVVFQVVFLMGMSLLGPTALQAEGSIVNFAILLAIVLIPSITWTIFYYLQDRRYPEPLSYLMAAFASGVTAAAAIAFPLVHVVFKTWSWIYADSRLFVLGSFFIYGSLFAILMYVVLRYGFYGSIQFDEPVDGMIYGAFSGTGFALVASLYYLYLHPDHTPFVIAYSASCNILVYSGIGSVIGYMLGVAKFKRRNIELYSFLAVALGIILLGIYRLFNEYLFVSGYSLAFWMSFGLSAAYALGILAFCYLKMRSLTVTALKEHVPVRKRVDIWMLVLIVLLLVTASWVSLTGSRGKQFIDAEHGISFYYPHDYSTFSFGDPDPKINLIHPNSRIIFYAETTTSSCCSLTVTACGGSPPGSQEALIQFIPVDDTESLSIHDLEIDGMRGKRLAYSYLRRETLLTSPYDFPQLMKVFLDVIAVEGRMFLFSFEAPAGLFEKKARGYGKFLKSIQWTLPETSEES
jgi:RsiW-degrading membrane proteinase PrsW (M82 family)